MRLQVSALSLFLSLMLTACGGKGALPLSGVDDAGTAGRERIRIDDPQGPIPAPDLPAGLERAARSAEQRDAADKEVYAYSVVCSVGGRSHRRQDSGGDKGENETDDADILVSAFEKTSTLYALMETPPATKVGLERRLSASLEEAGGILRSYGWYAGFVRGRIDEADGAVVVRVTFIPGPRYRMGESKILVNLPAMEGDGAEQARKRLPQSLEDAGLPRGAPAEAARVLASVDIVRERFLDNGYPFASIKSTRYIVDHEQRVLEAEITVACGPFTRMGDIDIRGERSVRPAYIEAMRLWRPGRPWRQSRLESFRDGLRQSGLFQSIDIAPGEAAPDGTRPVVVTLAGAPERTVSGAVKYHTDFGPGVQASWEHRNLTGRGDSLRLSAPLWMDMQEVTATYRLPFFLRRDQDFIAGGGFLNEDTDAYRLSSARIAAGLERRLSGRWKAGLQALAQGGSIKEPDESEREYLMYSMPLTFTYDSAKSLLDAASGQRLILSAAPCAGEYDGSFTALRARIEGQAFVPLRGEDSLVLAMRGVLGALVGEESAQAPPSVRFYSGGGGSVRGYAYQSIGPRNEKKDPLGGGSLVEVSSELRWKLSPEWGLVAFLDGGAPYEDLFGSTEEIQWGAGVGVRYYTVIGPVRIDLATPLNPRKDDDDLQVYISIGQSF